MDSKIAMNWPHMSVDLQYIYELRVRFCGLTKLSSENYNIPTLAHIGCGGLSVIGYKMYCACCHLLELSILYQVVLVHDCQVNGFILSLA